MRIGVPKEIKPQENRIGLTPDSVKTLVSEGHEVLVENNGGFEAGFENDHYVSSGAKIVNNAEDIFNDADIWDITNIIAFFNMSNRVASALNMKPNDDYHAKAR